MKALIIVRNPHEDWGFLGPDRSPALLPLLDRTVLQHQVESLIDQGVKDITVGVMTAIEGVRSVLRDGSRWGIRINIITLSSEGEIPARAQSVAEGGDIIIGDAEILVSLPETEGSWSAFGGRWVRRAANETEVATIADPDHLSVTKPDDYMAAWSSVVSSESFKLVRTGRPMGDGVVIGRGCQIHPAAQIEGPAYIGERCLIGAGCKIGPNGFIGADSIVEDGSIVADGLVLPYTFVGVRLEIRRKIAYRSTIFDLERHLALGSVDDFLLGGTRRSGDRPPNLAERLTALVLGIVGLPFALIGVLLGLVQPKPKDAIGYTSAFVDFCARFAPGLWSVVLGRQHLVGAPEISADARRDLETVAPGLVASTPVGLVSDAYMKFGPEPDTDFLWASFAISNAAVDSKSRRKLLGDYVATAFGIQKPVWRGTDAA